MLTRLEPYWLMVGPTLGTAVGLGFLLFIHEFGHFAVAKRAGVKVEIFSLGIAHFICSWTWNGTVYALSWLPLGGYVRMAGQQDLAPPPNHKPKPWEYGAKKPLVRMAIIVAGVTMNFIGGWLCYSASFAVGRDVDPPLVGKMTRDDPRHAAALDAGLRPRDMILSVDGDRVYTRVGLDMRIARITPGKTVTLDVLRTVEDEGVKKERRLTLELMTFERMKGISTIAPVMKNVFPLDPRSIRAGFGAQQRVIFTPLREEFAKYPAAWGQGLFRPADVVEEVDGKAVRSMNEFAEAMKNSGGKSLKVRVTGADGAEREIDLAMSPHFQVGIVFDDSRLPIRVLGVSKGSAAEKAGVKPGDRVYLGVEAKECTLAQFRAHIHRLAGRSITMILESGAENRRKPVSVTPKHVGWYPDPGQDKKGPELVPYGPLQIVRKVDAGSMAERKGLKPGAILRGIALESDLTAPIYITWAHQEKEYGPHKLELQEKGSSITWITPVQKRLKLGVGESLAAGWSETTETLLSTTVILRKVMNREVSPGKTLSGPISIVRVAYQSAQKGFGRMLWLLGLIGISLAFFNLLPIPVLDGGHLVFLGYEAIVRRPPPPRLVEIAQYAGLLLILCLFVFVFGNDILRMVQGG